MAGDDLSCLSLPDEQLSSPSPALFLDNHSCSSSFSGNDHLHGDGQTSALLSPSSTPTNSSTLSSPSISGDQPSILSPGNDNIPTPDPLLNPDLFRPLYPEANITLCGGLCAIMQFCCKNKLTYNAIGELLKLLHVLCPLSTSHLPKSFYHFKKFFEQFRQIHSHQKICLICESSQCSCVATGSNEAHLINLEIHKPLEVIISRKNIQV